MYEMYENDTVATEVSLLCEYFGKKRIETNDFPLKKSLITKRTNCPFFILLICLIKRNIYIMIKWVWILYRKFGGFCRYNN